MFINVGGVPGVGKTTITKEVEKFSRRDSFPLTRITGLKILCELAGVSSPAELRSLPEDVRKSLRPEMYRILYSEDQRDPLTLRLGDGHFCMYDSINHIFGIREIQPEDYTQLFGIVVITADPVSILNRRVKDSKYREDRQLDITFIKHEQIMEIDAARQQSNILDIPFLLINNQDELLTYSTSSRERLVSEGNEVENLQASHNLYDQIRQWVIINNQIAHL